MKIENSPSRVLTLAVSAALACLLGCGSDKPKTMVTTPALAVADGNNQRILLYNSPVANTSEAAVVLGQPGFGDSRQNLGRLLPSARTVDNPSAVARDAAGNLYVADGNNRVLQFRPPFTTFMSASLVFGQPGFTSTGLGTGPAGMGTPFSVAIDAKGDLWVGDGSNERVVEFKPPFSNGMAATLVIGRPGGGPGGFCTVGTPRTARVICSPTAIAFDSAGNLWVSDADSARVLEFKPPFSTGMAASLELGQPASAVFASSSSPGSSASSFGGPAGLAFDKSGNLWVADLDSNRVLEFAPPFTNGMAATMVLGQDDFLHNDPNRGGSSPSANTLSAPWGVSFDSSGSLIVADTQNSRILKFAPPFSIGMNATAVIGQPDFMHGDPNRGGGGGPHANTLFRPLNLSAF